MKKIIAMLLMVTMLVAVFASCNNTTDPSSAADPSSTSEPASDASTEDPASTPAADNYKIYLITMDQMDQYWSNIDAGCKEAAATLGNVDYTWSAPATKDDAQQIEYINNAVSDGAQGILLAANGPDAVTSALEAATAAGVKIVYVDSPANFEAVGTYSTDNEAAGKTAGETMIAQLKAAGIEEGKIGIVSVNTSTASTVARETGFRSAFEGSKFELLETQYADGDSAKSQEAAANFISQGVVGLFGANEGSAVGVGNAIKEAGSSIIGIGFDNSDAMGELISGGFIYATMVQNPKVMGAEGLKTLVSVLDGSFSGQLGFNEDTGVTVTTKDNL